MMSSEKLKVAYQVTNSWPNERYATDHNWHQAFGCCFPVPGKAKQQTEKQTDGLPLRCHHLFDARINPEELLLIHFPHDYMGY